MTACGWCPSCRFGDPCELGGWQGPVLVDLHDGRGTTWRRDARGRLYPDCRCHRPKGIR